MPLPFYSIKCWLNISLFSNYQTAWTTALKHLNQLSTEKQKFFNLLSQTEKDLLRNGVTPDDILHLLKQDGESRHSRFTRFSNRVASPFAQFQGVFEVTISTCSGIGAPMWAPMKLVLQGGSSFRLTSQRETNCDLDGNISCT